MSEEFPPPRKAHVAPPQPAWGGLPVVVRGATESLLVRGAGAVVAFAAHWALTQSLSMREYGAFVHVLGWIGILSLPCTLGFHLAAVRLVAGYEAAGRGSLVRGVAGYTWRVTLATSLAVGVVVGIGVSFVDIEGTPYTKWGLVAGVLLLPCASLTAAAAGTLRGLRRIAASRAPVALLRPLVLGGAAYALARGAPVLDTEIALAIGLGAYAVTAAVSLWLAAAAVRGAVGAGERLTRPRAWRMVALPLLGVTALEMVLTGIDLPLVALVLGEESAATFGAAIRFAGVLVFPDMAANSILGPVLAGANARGELMVRVADVRRVVRVVFALTLLGAILVSVFAAPLLAVFGHGYVAGAPALRLFAVAIAVSAAFGPHGLLLSMTDRARALNWTLGGTLALHLLGAAIVLPRWGVTGAGALACATAVFREVPLVYVCRRELGVQLTVLAARRGSSSEPPRPADRQPAG